MIEAILSVMLRMPIYDKKELEFEKERLRPIAVAINSATNNPNMIAALISIGWHESKWASLVIEGKCLEMPKGMQCDLDKKGNPRALGPWQLHKSACTKAWELGVNSYNEQAKCVVRILKFWKNQCHSEWHSTFSGYACSSCNKKKALGLKREYTMNKVLNMLKG